MVKQPCPPPTLCVDCMSPITAGATRCRRCSGRRTAGKTGDAFVHPPAPTEDPPDASRRPSAAEVEWLRVNGADLPVSQVVRLLGVSPARVRRLRSAQRLEA